MNYFTENAIRTLSWAFALLIFANTAWAQAEEVSGTVEDIGADYLVVEDMRFAVTADTRFEEQYTALSDVQVGDEVEVEYEDSTRRALEIERADEEEDEQEIAGSVREVGADYIVVDDARLAITSDTIFDEGYGALSDVRVGDPVEIEYEEGSDGNLIALEVEKEDSSDDDGRD